MKHRRIILVLVLVVVVVAVLYVGGTLVMSQMQGGMHIRPPH